MIAVRALPRDDVHLSGSAAAILGAIVVRGHLKFLDAVHRRFHAIAVHIGIVVIYAVQQKIIELFAAPARVHGERTARR